MPLGTAEWNYFCPNSRVVFENAGDRGQIMQQIIYCVLLIATWLCSTASVIWVLNFGGLEWMLVAGGCVASFVSSVALAEEFFDWHHHTEHLLPPAS